MKTYIAIDIGKETLRVQSETEGFDIANSPEGYGKLMKRVTRPEDTVVVCEATGGYEKPLIRYLQERSVGVRLVNPKRVRAFANSMGQRAKTDPIDARMLLMFAKNNQLQPQEPSDKDIDLLAELMDRRGQLNNLLRQEKNRLEKNPPHTLPSIKKMIRHIEKEIDSIEKQIKELIERRHDLQHQFQIICSTSGVGQVTAWSIIAYMSEIIHMNRNQAVALAGIAPYNRDSGKSSAKRSIQEGRNKVRKALFMAAQSAAVHNPVIKTYVQQLRLRGKPYKCAIVAAMRKILIHIQQLLKNNRVSA